MRYIYENRTDTTKLVTLVSESKTSVSHIPMAPGAKLELSYPGLDIYVPHWLSRVNDSGSDISASVVAGRELAKAPKSPVIEKETLKTPVSKEDKPAKEKKEKESDKE